MGTDRLQLQRLELKYIISEQQALAVRDFVQMYLEIDEYSKDKPNFSYRIHSLYLDSDDLKTYWDTINGTKNRYKLRLRYYNGDNAHVTQRRAAWWQALFAEAGARHPGVHWECGVDRIVVVKGEKEIQETRLTGG